MKDFILKEESYFIYVTNILNEDITSYSNFLSDEEKKKLSLFQSNKRKIEFSAVRYLLKKNIGNFTIQYNEEGAPNLINGPAISISHSHDFVIIGQTTKNKIGIDIERIQSKIKNIAHKFLNQEDIENLNNKNDEIEYTKIWCCKEAIFKISSCKTLSLKENIIIDLLSNSNATAIVKLNNETCYYSVKLHTIDDYIIAVVVK